MHTPQKTHSSSCPNLPSFLTCQQWVSRLFLMPEKEKLAAGVLQEHLDTWDRFLDNQMDLNISREGDSTTSLRSLFQCFVAVTPMTVKLFLPLEWNFLYSSFCALPLALLLLITKRSILSLI